MLFASLLLFMFQTAKSDEYTELVKTEVGVRVHPLKIFINSTEYGYIFEGNCSLTLHRGTCGNRSLREHEKISWSTKVCFLWKCDIDEHAMRVGRCWIGSRKNPVTIIKEDGSPLYATSSRAMSVGWLSVRESGMTHINVHCDIHLCHLCDDNCSRTTPPRSCKDVSPPFRDHDRVWSSSSTQELCLPTTIPPLLSSSSSFILFSSLVIIRVYFE